MGGLKAVSFDFGQTLGALDTVFLARRLADKGANVHPMALDMALPAAWAAYDEAVRTKAARHPWKLLMATLLMAAGVAQPAVRGLVDWLWDQQPEHNLWRAPIEPMIDLVRKLREEGFKVGVVSNSEGKLDQLVASMGLSELFDVVADSGAIGVSKPDEGIFRWFEQKMGIEQSGAIVHIGDSYEADVQGALAAGWYAIWFSEEPLPASHPRGASCATPDEIWERIDSWNRT